MKAVGPAKTWPGARSAEQATETRGRIVPVEADISKIPSLSARVKY